MEKSNIQKFAGILHRGTPEAGEVFAGALAEGVVLIPELRKPTIDMSGRVLWIEIVEVFLGERFLRTSPHQTGHPGNEDVAERVGVNGVNFGPVLDVVSRFGGVSLKVNIIEVLACGLEACFGVG